MVLDRPVEPIEQLVEPPPGGCLFRPAPGAARIPCAPHPPRGGWPGRRLPGIRAGMVAPRTRPSPPRPPDSDRMRRLGDPPEIHGSPLRSGRRPRAGRGPGFKRGAVIPWKQGAAERTSGDRGVPRPGRRSGAGGVSRNPECVSGAGPRRSVREAAGRPEAAPPGRTHTVRPRHGHAHSASADDRVSGHDDLASNETRHLSTEIKIPGTPAVVQRFLRAHFQSGTRETRPKTVGRRPKAVDRWPWGRGVKGVASVAPGAR